LPSGFDVESQEYVDLKSYEDSKGATEDENSDSFNGVGEIGQHTANDEAQPHDDVQFGVFLLGVVVLPHQGQQDVGTDEAWSLENYPSRNPRRTIKTL
jgi:hypothetical protein